MGEKWIQFVMRVKKEEGCKSLKEAMKAASRRKSEWSGSSGDHAPAKTKKAKRGKGRKTRKAKKGKKTRKGKKLSLIHI